MLGQRGAARTYLADDTDGLIVLKELSFSLEPAATTLQAFHQEARQLQSLTHPRIPRYLDMLQLGVGAETRLYLAQEFIEGTPLEAELDSRHYTELEARDLARQVLDILRYLQGRSPQVFHGDLKPANLIRRPDGALFLVDFGAGWVRGRASPEASHYTPPEQAGGELDATTDLFALGVTLVESLSWTRESRLRKEGEQMLATRVDVAVHFRDFLARLTSVDPAHRFASADAALRQLDSPESPRVTPRRRLGPVAIGAGAAVLLFAAGFVTGRVTQPAPPDTTEPGRSPTSPPQRPDRLGQRPPRGSLPSPPEMIHNPGTDQGPPQVREQEAAAHVPLACDFARAGTPSASSHWGKDEPQRAFDHDRQTFWQSADLNHPVLTVDLGHNHLIDSMVVDWAWDTRLGATARSAVMTSLDGVRWTFLHSLINIPSNNDVPRRVWFPQRVARYVRLVGASVHGSWMHVRSFELYGPDCPLPSPTDSALISPGPKKIDF
ncbi:serine/threonine protein kinase [Hyalangium gracile]|uniref:serine/threonine protein kinase n=1 Tax=Hyalangium gracile TaxID=394092 RepID=UPI001CCCB743|nr:discoidin domain-containing protein [Hyalangium gracile]